MKAYISISFLVIILFSCCTRGDISPTEHLRQMVNNYDYREPSNIKWMMDFDNFLKSSDLNTETPTLDNLINDVCLKLPEQKKQEQCFKGSLSFSNSIVGSSDVIDFILTKCNFGSKEPLCKYYKTMLNTDMGMLHTYLNPQDPN